MRICRSAIHDGEFNKRVNLVEGRSQALAQKCFPRVLALHKDPDLRVITELLHLLLTPRFHLRRVLVIPEPFGVSIVFPDTILDDWRKFKSWAGCWCRTFYEF